MAAEKARLAAADTTQASRVADASSVTYSDFVIITPRMDRLARAMFDLFATFQRQWCIAVRFEPPHAPVNHALGISRRPRRPRPEWAKMSGATDVRPSNSTRLVKAFDNSSKEK